MNKQNTLNNMEEVNSIVRVYVLLIVDAIL